MDFYMPIISGYTFKGIYNRETYYEYGDVCIRDGHEWINIGNNHWQEIGTNEIDDFPREKTEEEIIFQCRNCGAPTHHDGVCPYCGTINRKVKRIYAR